MLCVKNDSIDNAQIHYFKMLPEQIIAVLFAIIHAFIEAFAQNLTVFLTKVRLTIHHLRSLNMIASVLAHVHWLMEQNGLELTKKVWQKRLWVHIIVLIGDSEMYTNLPTTFLELKSDTNSADSLKGSWSLWAGPKLHWVRKYGSLLEKGFLKLHLATFENTTHVQSYCL